MIEKIKTAIWFARRPGFYAHATALAFRKLKVDYEAPKYREQATNWAAERALPLAEALDKVGLLRDGQDLPAMDKALINEAEKKATQSRVKMGGPGDLSLIYSAVVLSNAHKVIETGVAYGWSSLAILAGLLDKDGAKLISVDMPYPKMGNESFVGIVVPERFKSYWSLIRQPDRPGVQKAIAQHKGEIDLCHYDSDKSWYGRNYAYPMLWDALKTGGVFISDDIQDNMAFAEFVEAKNIPFAVTESHGKYVGILRKV